MIIFVCSPYHLYTHKSLLKAMPGEVRVCGYPWLLQQKVLPRGTYIFTDRERMDYWELRVFGALFRHINQAGDAYKAINDPLTMLDRPAMLRKLYRMGINHFNAYLVSECVLPERYPVFIRRMFDHGKPLTGLIDNEHDLQEELGKLADSGEPFDGLLIIEYCAEPLEGTLFRKLSSYRIGEEVFFHNTVHEENWLVKYGTLNSATNAMYLDEQKMFLENAYCKELRKAFDVAGIQYGRADFGLVAGQVQVYEINTNPHTTKPKAHPNAVRTQTMQMAWEKYLATLRQLDTTTPSAQPARQFKHEWLVRKRFGARRISRV